MILVYVVGFISKRGILENFKWWCKFFDEGNWRVFFWNEKISRGVG